MQIQPFSVNDGDGIRSTIFLAGCPLRCKWCANPEGFAQKELVGWYERKCIGCGACAAACPQGIGINMNAAAADLETGCTEAGAASSGAKAHADNVPDAATGMQLELSAGHMGRDLCVACGRCVDVCPTGARTRMVTMMEADDVISRIQKHRLFYAYSGGGVTFSGGEATSQPDFLDELTSRIYDMGISMDIETCGMFEWDRIEPILRRMDLVFMDLKHMDPEIHRKWTGASNERILENIANLARLRDARPGSDTEVKRMHAEIGDTLLSTGDGAPQIVIRIPVIGGVNDDDDNIRKSAAFVRENVPGASMELLPYHVYGKIKYEALGMPYDHPELATPDRERMERLRAIVTEEGVEAADFR